MTTWQTLLAVAGLTVVSVVTRGFFMLPEREVPIPAWLREALRYAPLAALVAVVMPEIVMSGDHFVATWKDARLFGALAGAITFGASRHLLATILAGSAVFLALRLLLGW